MTQAMEEALAAAWQEVKGTALPTAGREDRQLLFTAIAQGVVRHLKDQAGVALSIKVTAPPDHEISAEVDNVLTEGVLYP